MDIPARGDNQKMVSPMRDDLTELLERVEFCRTRSLELEAKVEKLAGASISHWVLPWPQPGEGEIMAKLLSHPPVSIRQEVGMIVNEQRSILDALACKLATRNGANSINDVYFPIVKTREIFFDKISKRKIRRLDAADQQAIEDLKPWNPTGNDPEDGNLALFQLHEADRVRKHQELLRWACLSGAQILGDGQVGRFQSSPVVFTEVGKAEKLAFFSDVTCQIGVQFQIVYLGPDALNGRAVAPLLSIFNESVEKAVKIFA